MAEPQPLNLEPEEAIEFFRRKGMHVGFDWRDTAAEMHARSFTVAKAMEQDVLQDIRDAVDRAIAEGQSFQQFRKGIEPLLRKKGWWGVREMKDPVTGIVRQVQLGSPRRLQIIYDTNMRTAYAHGQWQRIQAAKEILPYLRYSAVQDSRTRPQHMAWHGIVLPVDHPFWQTHYPPNGWRCRCNVTQLAESDLERRGLKVTENPPTGTRIWANARTGMSERVPIGIDPGFARNVGTAAGGLAADAIQNAAPTLFRVPLAVGAHLWRDITDWRDAMGAERNREAWEERYRWWVNAAPGPGVQNAMVVGALHPDHVDEIAAFMDIQRPDRLSAAVLLGRRGLNHMTRPSKEARGAALAWQDVLRIPEILRNPKAVVLQDAENRGDRAVLYVFDPSGGDRQAGKIAVRVGLVRRSWAGARSRTVVRANWVVTGGLVQGINLKGGGLKLIAGSLE